MVTRIRTHRATATAALVTATSLVGVGVGVGVTGVAAATSASASTPRPQAVTAVAPATVAALPAGPALSMAGAATKAATRSAAGRDVRAVAVPKGVRGKVVYLTFDDGPDRRYTPAILSILAKHKARATFFMIGSQAKANPALVRQVRAQGHTIGNHTYSHPWLTKVSAARVAAELRSTDAVLGRTTCMRPPGGFVNGTVRTVAAAANKRVVMWGIDTSDWSRPGAARIAGSVMRGSQAGSIVLMHDGGGPRAQTVSALPNVLSQLSRKGYRFEPLPMCR